MQDWPSFHHQIYGYNITMYVSQDLFTIIGIVKKKCAIGRTPPSDIRPFDPVCLRGIANILLCIGCQMHILTFWHQLFATFGRRNPDCSLSGPPKCSHKYIMTQSTFIILILNRTFFKDIFSQAPVGHFKRLFFTFLLQFI